MNVISSRLLKIWATCVTFLTFGGMTAFAVTNPQNPAAPLKPTLVDAAPTPSPAPTRTVAPRRDQQRIAPQIPTTTAAPRTKTHRS